MALPAILPALRDQATTNAASTLHATIQEARDLATRDGWAGIRLVPTQAPPALEDGTIDPDAPLMYSKIVPLAKAPDYAEGLASIHDDYTPEFLAMLRADYGRPLPNLLILEESLVDAAGNRSNPTSWYWNLRVGETVHVLGRPYTIAGPMVAGPAQGNSEGFVNVGPAGTASPLSRVYDGGPTPVALPVEFLYLANRADDDGDGLVDEGWNGFDDDFDSMIDEDDEWESERWGSTVGVGTPAAFPYRVARRPYPAPAKSTELASGAVIDATSWFGVEVPANPENPGAGYKRTAPMRPRLPVWRWTGAVELTFDPAGRIDMPSPYGRPASSPLGTRWAHFWIADVGDVAYPPKSDPGSAKLVSVDVNTGRLVAGDADPSDVEGSYARAEGSRR
jgi:hypothetical protein